MRVDGRVGIVGPVAEAQPDVKLDMASRSEKRETKRSSEFELT